MSQVYANCTHCGSNLTPEDYQQPACRYCGTAHRHHQEAAAKAAEVRAVMQGFMPQMPPVMGPNGPQAGPAVVVVPGMQPIVHASTKYVVGGPPLGQSPPMTGGPVGGAPLGAPPGWNGQLQQPYGSNPAGQASTFGVVIAVIGALVGLAAAVAGWLFTR